MIEYQTVKRAGLGVAYILVSATLLNFNKAMMSAERFPFAGPLTMIHITTTFLGAMLLYAGCPSLFPTMAKTQGKHLEVVKYFLPVSLAFTLNIVFANMAFQYSSVPFCQFMKQANVGFIFICSCILGTQVPDRLKAVTIAFIIWGSATAVHGAIVFALLGFLCQALSQCGEVTKIMLQERILSGDELKLDPLTYQLFICPGSWVALFLLSVFTWNDQILPRMLEHWPLLLLNALVAFALNVVIASFIKEASAMEFVLCGLIKDACIVIGTATLTGEQLAVQQIVGFTMTSCGILYWSLQKIMPNHPAVTTAKELLGLEAKQEENEPILPAGSAKV